MRSSTSAAISACLATCRNRSTPTRSSVRSRASPSLTQPDRRVHRRGRGRVPRSSGAELAPPAVSALVRPVQLREVVVRLLIAGGVAAEPAALQVVGYADLPERLRVHLQGGCEPPSAAGARKRQFPTHTVRIGVASSEQHDERGPSLMVRRAVVRAKRSTPDALASAPPTSDCAPESVGVRSAIWPPTEGEAGCIVGSFARCWPQACSSR